MFVLLNIMLIIIMISSRIYMIELHYQGISLTWRRIVSSESNTTNFEMIIKLALSDKSFHLCDSHHNTESSIGIECLESWDNCLSWPFHTLSIQCHSKAHEYPKSIIFHQIKLSLPSDINSKNIFYKTQFPSSNYSCCWQDFDSFDNPVQLISYLNIFDLNEINSSPISRFPEHIYINLNKDFIYSLEVFDPDGDLFICQSLTSISSILISENCIISIKSNSLINENEIILKIEIIEYLNNKKDKIRSRLPYHIIAFIDDDQQTDPCYLLPSINFLNIENNLIHVLLNQSIQIHLISQSHCEIPMDECFINSHSQWKIKSIIEKNILNHQSQIEMEFEWIPKSIQQCGFSIHCIRCADQFTNHIDKCINIFIYGPQCQNLNPANKICVWSSFSIWSKNNQTTYKRSRTCHEQSNDDKACSHCFGSSIEYQTSLAFQKDFELFEQSLLSPTRAHSTIKMLLIITIIYIFSIIMSILISLYYGINKFVQQKKLKK